MPHKSKELKNAYEKARRATQTPEQRKRTYIVVRKWQKAHPEILKANTQRWLKEHPEHKMLYTAKMSAKRKGLEFSIEVEDIIIPTHCPYLGIPLTYLQNVGRVSSNMSIDRIDSTKGYVKGNIQVISDLANRMKNNATPEQLVLFAKGVLAMYC